jgi:prolipoprotein diacylglyceryltransferase
VYGALTRLIFPVTIGIGIGVGMLWMLWPVSVFPKIARIRFDVAAIGLGSGLIGGRVVYVTINWETFRHSLVEIPQIWLGGLSWVGVLMGGILAVVVVARKRGIPVGNLVDGLRPLFTSIVISTWLACWMTGIAYGVEIDAWWGILARDEWGVFTKRWPIQMVGAFSALGFQWLTDRLLTRKWIRVPGLAAVLILGGFSVTNLGLSPFRGDTTLQWAGMGLDTWASLFCFILCLLYAITLATRTKLNRSQ